MSYEPGGSYRQLWADSASKRAFKLGLTLYHCAEPNHEDDNQYPDDDTFILVNGAVDSGVVDAETIERLLDELERAPLPVLPHRADVAVDVGEAESEVRPVDVCSWHCLSFFCCLLFLLGNRCQIVYHISIRRGAFYSR